MSQFDLLIGLCFGLYLLECFLWVPAGGWLFLAWGRDFSLTRGPAFLLRNLWPLGYAYRFPASEQKPLDPSRALSVKDARERWASFQKDRRILSWMGRGLIAVVVAAFLLWAFRRGFWIAWGILFFSFLFLHLSITGLFWRSIGKLYPGRKGRKIGRTLLCFFSPWQSSRAADLLGEGLLEEFHPLAVGKVLLGEETFLQFAHRWLLEVKYPARKKMEKASVPLLLTKTSGEEEKRLLQWLTDQKMDTQELLRAPQPSRPGQGSYCPRCESEYTLAVGVCNDCGWELVPFK